MSVIEVLGSADNNHSNITCVALSLSAPFILESKPAVLLVFKPGLSESVSNLTVIFINSTTVLIAWSPPFTLEGVPILGYNVTITNTTSGENESMLLNSTGHSDPQTSFLYSIDYPDPEYSFIVIVVPINKFGAGQPAVTSVISVSSTSSAIIKSHLVQLSLPFNTMTANTLPSTAINIARTSDTAASSMLGPLTTTPDSSGMPGSRAPVVLLSTVGTVSVVTMVTMITTIVIILSCCLLKKHKTIKAAKPPTDDVVPVSNNPAYGKITIRSIKMKENTAYATIQPAILPQYENVVMKENNEFVVELTDAAAVVPSHAEDFAMKENSAYAMTQLSATPVAPQFVMKENSAYGIAQPAVSPEHEDIVMKENTAYTTTTTNYY